MARLLSVLIVLFLFWKDSESARILGVFPTPSISHQVVFRALTMELSNRGHELFIFTPDPVKNSSLMNYKEIDMHYTYSLMVDVSKNDDTSSLKLWYAMSETVSEAILSHPEMQRIIAPNSTEHFDLIIVEYLSFEAIYALQHHFKIPMIGVVSLPIIPPGHYLIGNPHALTYSPTIFDPYTDDMNFWLRLYNVYRYLCFVLVHRFDNLARQDKVLKKYFGEDLPHASDLGKEISLVLTNSNPILGYPKPNIPGVIEVGGLSVNIQMKGLEQNLKNFLDSATDGFVYFSLGSILKSEDFPAEKLNTLISVFASLPYKVLWKWGMDELPGKPENVFISKWLPQHDVLAHPNIRAFIYQGGLQSTEEAISLAVPLIGLPVINDQEFNVRKLASVKVGKRVNFEPLNGDELREAIVEVVTDKSYKERMMEFRQLFHDQLNHPMEKAIWWTEYVIRHNGAPHMRPKVRHLAWYQRELLDILSFVLVIVFLILYITYKVARFLVPKFIGSLPMKVKTN